jgi:hypothetical protein
VRDATLSAGARNCRGEELLGRIRADDGIDASTGAPRSASGEGAGSKAMRLHGSIGRKLGNQIVSGEFLLGDLLGGEINFHGSPLVFGDVVSIARTIAASSLMSPSAKK